MPAELGSGCGGEAQAQRGGRSIPAVERAVAGLLDVVESLAEIEDNRCPEQRRSPPTPAISKLGSLSNWWSGASAFAADRFARPRPRANALNSYAICRQSAPQSGPPVLAACQLTSGSPVLAFGRPEAARRRSCSFLLGSAGPVRARTARIGCA